MEMLTFVIRQTGVIQSDIFREKQKITYVRHVQEFGFLVRMCVLTKLILDAVV